MVLGDNRARAENLVLHHAVAAVPIDVHKLVKNDVVDLPCCALGGIDAFGLFIRIHSLSHVFIVGIGVNIV